VAVDNLLRPVPGRQSRSMLLQLDPHLPVVWRDPTTVQLGVDVVAAVLTEVDAADERLLSVLARGVAGGAQIKKKKLIKKK